MRGATVTIMLEDTTFVDVPSRVVSRVTMHNVWIASGRDDPLRFELNAEHIDEKASYTISVHVDADGDGKIGPGDYINMISYPVITGGHPTHVRVHVERVP